MKTRILTFVFLSSFVILTGCNQGNNSNHEKQGTKKEEVKDEFDLLVQAVLWQQTAGEYRALCYQAFNIAQLRLDQFLAEEKGEDKKLAIVTDVDETVLDNSPFEGKLIEKGEPYTEEEWANWVNRGEAKAVPGATDFLNYASDQNVEIFYISNRKNNTVGVTLTNMKAVNFPYADSAHVLFKTDKSAKKERFDKVAEDYEILLFIGDNLGDFSSEFRAPSIDKRFELTDRSKTSFGHKFIVLPNPMYGDWETKGVFKGKYDWTSEQKDSIRKSILKSY